jgi:2TM domain-containing protein
MPPTTTNERPEITSLPARTSDDTELRARARRQVERVHAFKLQFFASGIGMLAVVCIWAITEYHNAGGWPHDFSQSSGTPGVWNSWIIWPLLAWVFFISARAYSIWGRRPPAEAEIQREMERMRREG